VIQPSQLTSSRDAKILKVLAPQSSHSLPDRNEPSNTPHPAGLAPVVREKELYVHNFRSSVGDMSRQGGKASYSVGPIKIECDAPINPQALWSTMFTTPGVQAQRITTSAVFKH